MTCLRVVGVVLVFLMSGAVLVGQAAYDAYAWEEADIAIAYPSSWDEPLPLPSAGGPREILRLSEGFVDNPESRPRGFPIINIVITSEDVPDEGLYDLLANVMQTIDITPSGPLPIGWLGNEAIFAAGTDDTGDLFGIGRVGRLADGRLAVIVGRVTSARRADFSVTFDLVADSIVDNTARDPIQPEYGVRWLVESLPVDGSDAFINLGAMTLSPDGTTLYVADGATGLIELDSSTGQIRQITPLIEETDPTDLAIRNDGTIYLADLSCQCVRVIQDGIQRQTIDNFSEGSPRSVAWLDGTFYATDVTDDNANVLAVGDERVGRLMFDPPIDTEPLLTVDLAGRLLALADDRSVYVLEGDMFTLAYELSDALLGVTEITIDSQNNLVVATEDRGIIRFDTAGELVDTLGIPTEDTPPAPGEMANLVGVAASNQGAIYWADSDGEYSTIVASNVGVEPGRVGLTNLISGVAVQGVLDDEMTQQIWTLDAEADEQIDLTAITDETSGDLDIAVRILAPDGSELLFVQDDESGLLFNETDVNIEDLVMPQAGRYVVIVEREFGTGRYVLGFNRPRTLDLNEGVTQVQGEITPIFSTQDWLLDASAGQTLTITLEATSGDLDTILLLVDDEGDLIAENDDAEDEQLETDSQIVDQLLPFSETYRIQVTGFDGTGRYTLTVEAN